ncbi:MAG: LON peptidase substrate-binding domain-containing protein, partial [Kingella sp. (in: b-proteobacteria)]
MALKKLPTRTIPTLPLRDMVVYPNMVLPLFVGRPKSVAAMNAAMENGKTVFLLAQKNSNEEEPKTEELQSVGTIADILQVLKLPDGTIKVLVEGKQRARVQVLHDGEYIEAVVHELVDYEDNPLDQEALRRSLLSQFEQYIKTQKRIAPEVWAGVQEIEDNGRLADTIA